MKLSVTQRAQNKSNIISNQSLKTHLVTTKIKSHIHIHPQPSLLRNPPPLCYQNAIYAEKLVSLQGSLYKFANNFSKNQTHHSIYEEYIYLHIGHCLLYIYTQHIYIHCNYYYLRGFSCLDQFCFVPKYPYSLRLSRDKIEG